MIATCIYCGHQVQHGSHQGATQQEAHKALIEHDRQCPQNPIAHELAVERERADALAAHVERLTSSAAGALLDLPTRITPRQRDLMIMIGPGGETPDTSLARVKAQWQAEGAMAVRHLTQGDDWEDEDLRAVIDDYVAGLCRQAKGGDA